MSNPLQVKKTNSNDFENLKWKFALENSNIGVWDWNSETNSVVYSKESKQIIGFKDNEIASKASEWYNRIHKEDKQSYFKTFTKLIDGDIINYENSYRILHKDNTYRWILDKGKTIEKDINNRPKRIIGTHSDITKQKKAKIMSKKRLDLITSQNKKLKNFTYVVSHNLKQHAGNIESIIEFYNEAESDKEKEEMIKHLKTVSESLTKTLKDSKEIVVVQSKKFKTKRETPVYSIIDATTKELNYLISKSNTTIYNDVKKDCLVNFSASYLQSIIQNLITNAIKYKHPDRSPIIKINSIQTDKQIEISVSDNGIGIDLNKYGKDLFGLYKTFHNNKNAEGIGLYLVKNQLEAFKGNIKAISEVDKGTTFIMTIPIK